MKFSTEKGNNNEDISINSTQSSEGTKTPSDIDVSHKSPI